MYSRARVRAFRHVGRGARHLGPPRSKAPQGVAPLPRQPWGARRMTESANGLETRMTARPEGLCVRRASGFNAAVSAPMATARSDAAPRFRA
jgi:hypothetical protein